MYAVDTAQQCLTRRLHRRIRITHFHSNDTPPPKNSLRVLIPTGKAHRCLNLGSYNYLGFASWDEYCTPRVLDSLREQGWAVGSTRAGCGTRPVHVELEEELADFLGTEAALVCGMGYATNALFIPVLGGPGTLILSDALNHASIVAGARSSGATIRVFDHDDAAHAEQVLRRALAEGQPRTHRPWKKVLIIVEGVYSMEGELCDVASFVKLKKRYGAYLWLDEAHSIGALGATGRGVCERLGVNMGDVDVLMGTFSKSFGACGGYVAGSRELVEAMRWHSPASLYGGAMSPPAVEQVRSALRVIRGADGSRRGAVKLAALRRNANYFRAGLLSLGLNVLGTWDSPVMPIMVFHPAKLSGTSREMLRLGAAVVEVGFPATPLLTTRMRVCISAAHTKADLDFGLHLFDHLADMCALRYGGEEAKKIALECPTPFDFDEVVDDS